MAKSKTIKDVEAEEKVKKGSKKQKEVKSEVESEILEKTTKVQEKKSKEKEKDNKKEKKDGYFKVLGRELKKVVWPNAGDIAKYSIAVIVFCLILILFFLGIEALASFIKGLF